MKISPFSFANTETHFGRTLEELVQNSFVTRAIVRDFWTIQGERLPELNLCEVAGIRLRFKMGKGDWRDSDPINCDCILVGATYHAINDFLSPGFRGKLPHDICFSDNRDVLFRKVPLPLVSEGNLPQGGESLGFEGDCGHLTWSDAGFLLHALFLGKLQRTIRITTMLSQ